MKFCPKCEVRLKSNTVDSSAICPKCGYSEKESQSNIDNSQLAKAKKEEGMVEKKSVFNVFDESEKDDTLPTINIVCPKCAHNEAVWWMIQTRSADEPTTQFYRCTKCSHTWRDYS